MTNRQTKYREPYGSRDYELVRHGEDGTYWQTSAGLTVRVAASEGERERSVARDLLAAWLLPLLLLARAATVR